jgi:hypothetical protein
METCPVKVTVERVSSNPDTARITTEIIGHKAVTTISGAQATALLAALGK